MIKAFTIADPEESRYFENFVFTYPQKHNIQFDFPADTFIADGVSYCISTIQQISSTNNVNVQEQSSSFNTLESYAISKQDIQTNTEYYGFVGTEGQWYILKIDKVTNSYKYANGSVDFAANWTDRETLEFFDFNELTW